ncbi:hypothetical protein RIF29_14962 [Crotalaria pallida]|uniref:Uncharacterized protein n=1 Tax=Crotalaria pallida TaxID=3830 RepID=A0AAN9IE76_CROPI
MRVSASGGFLSSKKQGGDVRKFDGVRDPDDLVPDLLRSKNNSSSSQADYSQGSKKIMSEEKVGGTEAEVSSSLGVQLPLIDSGALTNIKGSNKYENSGGEKRVGWKKLARKGPGVSPAVSPNSGLKRKEVCNAGEGNRVVESRQGVAQKLKLMAVDESDDAEAARTGAQISNAVGGSVMKAGDRRFFFETGWARLEGCEDIIREVWEVGLRPFSLTESCSKLEKTTLSLKEWTRKAMPCIPKEIKSIQDRIEKLDRSWESSETLEQRKLLISKMNELLELEEKKWKQRSKVHWLKEGDQNTKFFHQRASQRKRKNTVRRLKSNGGIEVTDEDGMGAITINYFSNLFDSVAPPVVPEVIDVVEPRVTPEMNSDLCKPFTEDV